MADESEQDQASKTEDPTPRKLEEARKRGQVAISREVNAWLLLIATTLIVGTMMTNLFRDLGPMMARYLGQADDLPTGPGGIGHVLYEAVISGLWVMLPIFALLMLAAFIGPFAQAGPLFVPELLKMDLQKISPIKGLERLFSRKAILEFVRGLVKISVVSVVTYFILHPYLPHVDHFVGLPMALLMDELHRVTLRLLIGIAIVLMIFAGLDLFYQRFDYYHRMRMTKQEVKDEYRQTEGDPMIRGRLRQLRLQRARQRMMQNVPKADVVITNPTHFAVALQYLPDEMQAPKVVAKGADLIAARIREVARASKVEIVENPPLARALYDKVEIDQIIPPDLYKAVAEVITYVFKKTGKMRA